MSTDPLMAAFIAEVERVHPDYECNGYPPNLIAVSAPEPCEHCGTRVFGMQVDDLCGPVKLFHVGWLQPIRAKVRMVEHRPEWCSDARRMDKRLEGWKPPRPAALAGSADDTREGTT